MTNQEIRNLSKLQTLELIYQQEEEINRLNAVNQELEAKVNELKLRSEQTASLSEAVTAAQSAIQAVKSTANSYSHNIKVMESERIIAAEKIIHDAQAHALQVREEANRYYATIVGLINEKIMKTAKLYEWQKNQNDANFAEFSKTIQNLGFIKSSPNLEKRG